MVAAILGAVEDLAVCGKLFDTCVCQAVIAELFDDVLGGGMKAARAAHTMEACDVFEIAFGCFAGEFLRERCHDGIRQQCRLGCVG